MGARSSPFARQGCIPIPRWIERRVLCICNTGQGSLHPVEWSLCPLPPLGGEALHPPAAAGAESPPSARRGRRPVPRRSVRRVPYLRQARQGSSPPLERAPGLLPSSGGSEIPRAAGAGVGSPLSCQAMLGILHTREQVLGPLPLPCGAGVLSPAGEGAVSLLSPKRGWCPNTCWSGAGSPFSSRQSWNLVPRWRGDGSPSSARLSWVPVPHGRGRRVSSLFCAGWGSISR